MPSNMPPPNPHGLPVLNPYSSPSVAPEGLKYSQGVPHVSHSTGHYPTAQGFAGDGHVNSMQPPPGAFAQQRNSMYASDRGGGFSSGGGEHSGIVGGISGLSMGYGGGGGAMWVSLEIKAVGLRDKDLIGKSDPMCKVFVPDGPLSLDVVGDSVVRNWKELGRTEVVENCTAPNWSRWIKVRFCFEQHQPLKFEVVDVDNKKSLKGDELGVGFVALAEIVSNGLVSLNLTNGEGNKKEWGRLIIRAHDENGSDRVRVKLAFGGKGLDKKDIIGKSDPYYVLKRIIGNDISAGLGSSVIYKSKEIKNTCNPTWEPHTLKIPTKGKAWQQVQLQATVYDWDKYTPHDLIGDVTFTLGELTNTPYFNLINSKKAGKRFKYKHSGQLVIHRAEAVELPSFVSYLQGGLQLNFIVAVDFTASNRPVDNPASLHFLHDPQRPSQYAQALYAVGTILSPYIPDGNMTALGFGAILPGQGNVPCFDFALSGQFDPRVRGVRDLLQAYELAATNVTLAGPTYFAPLIRNAMTVASACPVTQTTQHFSILLILTDGIITDLSTTIDAIIECSHNTPMAIVIVGIGEADFASMERLDGDDHILRSDSGRQAKHDIVQFTKFDRNKSIDILASDILHEVPERVVEYMVDAGITPNHPAY